MRASRLATSTADPGSELPAAGGGSHLAGAWIRLRPLSQRGVGARAMVNCLAWGWIRRWLSRVGQAYC